MSEPDAAPEPAASPVDDQPAAQPNVPLGDDGSPLVCFCFRVTRNRLMRAITQQGATTVEDLNMLTGACGGCASCRWDLEDLLAEAQRADVDDGDTQAKSEPT